MAANPSPSPNCYVVYLEYTKAHRPAGLEVMRALCENLGLRVRSTVIVDNASTSRAEFRLDRETSLISGDNRAQDISGYDCGLKWHAANGSLDRDSIFVFANDTFHRPRAKFSTLPLFGAEVVRTGIRKGAVIGFVDEYPKPIRLFGLETQTWIRTNLFIVGYPTLKKLMPFALEFPDNTVFAKNPSTFFKSTAPLSPNYQSYLKAWLFGVKASQSRLIGRWHNAGAPNASNVMAFRSKARAILSEHYLGARIQQARIPFQPVNNGPTGKKKTVYVGA